MSACEKCLRRSRLVALLAPRIADVVARPAPRLGGGILALEEGDLIAAVAGSRADAARRFLADFNVGEARAQCERADIAALCLHATDYPSELLDLADPPPVLYVLGGSVRLGELRSAEAVAIVGAREASSYALEVAHDLGRRLTAAGITVVSGLARGVDAAAHRGAVEAGGRAIAVLASGPDVVYPRRNRGLYERVLDHGVVVSELPPGCGVFRWSFPARNRIMAALTAVTVVVEAAEPSGSLVTARFAGELGREVGAVPGRVTSRMASGSNRLLRDGATVVLGPDEILDALFGAGGGPRASADEPALSLPLRRVLDGVEAGEGTASIGRRAGLSAGAVRAALGRLESLGLVARDGIGSYERRVGR